MIEPSWSYILPLNLSKSCCMYWTYPWLETTETRWDLERNHISIVSVSMIIREQKVDTIRKIDVKKIQLELKLKMTKDLFCNALWLLLFYPYKHIFFKTKNQLPRYNRCTIGYSLLRYEHMYNVRLLQDKWVPFHVIFIKNVYQECSI